MASAGLKRPSPSDVPPHSSNQLSPNSYWAANKRRCTVQMAQQQRLFRDPAALIGPLSDDVALLIRNEVSKQQQQQQHHHHHHHQQPQQQQPHQHQQLHHQQQQQQHHHHQQQQTHNQHHNQQHPQQQQHQEQLHPHPSASMTAATAALKAAVAASIHPQHNQSNLSNTNSAPSPDTPVLSIRQAQAIFEKLIREREQKLREEYDKILISKLSEQYDTFVKYTHDHIERRYNETNSHQASYLS